MRTGMSQDATEVVSEMDTPWPGPDLSTTVNQYDSATFLEHTATPVAVLDSAIRTAPDALVRHEARRLGALCRFFIARGDAIDAQLATFMGAGS